MVAGTLVNIHIYCRLTTESRSDTPSSLSWEAVASLRFNRTIFFYQRTFKAVFLWRMGVRQSQFHYFRKVVSKIALCYPVRWHLQASFSKQAYQTRENSHKLLNLSSKTSSFFAAPVKCSSHQMRTASSDCLHLVAKVNLSVYMQHKKNKKFSSKKGTRPLTVYVEKVRYSLGPD